MAVDTVFVLAADNVVFGVVGVGFVCALVDADFAADAPLFIAFYKVLGW